MDNGDKNIFDTYGKGSDHTWYAVETDTPFGPARGLVSGDKIGLSSMKAISMDEFLQWGRERLGDDVHIEMAAADAPVTATFRADVERLLNGQSASLTPDLSGNTPFQLQVAEAVYDIPYGHTASYGDIAVAVGKPGGAQAVGNALPRMPFALFFPSHRIVRSTGDSVGCTLLTYDLKTGLLQWERERC